jgi:hypothetical protein
MTKHIADRFAHMEAEFKALKKQYEALKEEALTLCMAKAGDDLTAFIAGDMFALEYSMTPVNQFSSEKAKAFLTEEQIAACYTQTTRQNLKPKLLANVKVFK